MLSEEIRESNIIITETLTCGNGQLVSKNGPPGDWKQHVLGTRCYRTTLLTKRTLDKKLAASHEEVSFT
jgi:hypothetical protein